MPIDSCWLWMLRRLVRSILFFASYEEVETDRDLARRGTLYSFS